MRSASFLFDGWSAGGPETPARGPVGLLAHCVTLIPPGHRRGWCAIRLHSWSLDRARGAWTPHVFPPLTVDSMKKCQRLGPLASPTTNSIGCADEGQSQGRPYPGHVPPGADPGPSVLGQLQRCGELTRVLVGKGRHRGIDDAEGARVAARALGCVHARYVMGLKGLLFEYRVPGMAVLGAEGHVALAEPLAPTASSCTPSPARRRRHRLFEVTRNRRPGLRRRRPLQQRG